MVSIEWIVQSNALANNGLSISYESHYREGQQKNYPQTQLPSRLGMGQPRLVTHLKY